MKKPIDSLPLIDEEEYKRQEMLNKNLAILMLGVYTTFFVWILFVQPIVKEFAELLK